MMNFLFGSRVGAIDVATSPNRAEASSGGLLY